MIFRYNFKVFQQHVSKLGKEENICWCCFFNWKWKFEEIWGVGLLVSFTSCICSYAVVNDVVHCVYRSFEQPNKFLDKKNFLTGCLIDNLIIIPLRNATYMQASLSKLTFEYFFVQISVQVWLKVELIIRCYSDFRCEVTVVYAWLVFVFQYDHFRCLDLDLDLDLDWLLQ